MSWPGIIFLRVIRLFLFYLFIYFAIGVVNAFVDVCALYIKWKGGNSSIFQAACLPVYWPYYREFRCWLQTSKQILTKNPGIIFNNSLHEIFSNFLNFSACYQPTF